MLHPGAKAGAHRGLRDQRPELPKSKLGKAIHYALCQWPKLELFLADGRVEIDNNLLENAIRPTKLGAKNWLFLGNVQSGGKCAILYTIVENCRRLGLNPRAYLEDVLTRLPAMKASEAASLTPARWLAARRAKAARPAA
ncbi:MAG: IS66 family transposase [Luteolibacter sp.]